MASLLWVIAFAIAGALVVIDAFTAADIPFVSLSLAWSIGLAAVAILQLAVALQLDFRHDRLAPLAFLLAPLLAMAYWMIWAAAALPSEAPALARGPSSRVVWTCHANRSTPSVPAVALRSRAEGISLGAARERRELRRAPSAGPCRPVRRDLDVEDDDAVSFLNARGSSVGPCDARRCR